MPDTLPPLTPPQDTYTGGTAVQTATDPEGHKWQYDNEGGNWVNLDTGEAVSPKIFSQMAGRSGNAARDTMALAEAMRREEATLAPPPRTAPMAPRAQATIAPPTMPTGTNPVIAPERQYTPDQVAQVMAQKPIPSTRVPPSAAANQAYNLQAYQRAITMGMTPKQAAAVYLPGMLAAQTKPIHVGDALVNPVTGQPIYTAPPKAITPAQQASMTDRAARTEILQKATEARIKAAAEKSARELSPAAKQRVKLMEADIANERKLMAAAPDDQKPVHEATISKLVSYIEDEYRKGNAPLTGIVPPAGRTTGPQAAGRKFKDASGKTWSYVGTSPSPLTDTDVSHWKED